MIFLTIGNGAWGTAVASVLAEAGGQSSLLVSRVELANQINTLHRNEAYLPGLPLSSRLRAVTMDDIPENVGCVIWAIPIQYLRTRCQSYADRLRGIDTMINLGKGIEAASGSLPSNVLRSVFPKVSAIGTLAGPNIAAEVVMGKYAEATLAMTNAKQARRIAGCFDKSQLQIRLVDDVQGVEVAAALKNVAAIAGGLADGLSFGDNGKALIVARVWEELWRIGVRFGASRDAFYSVTAIADLYATANSPIGRNRRIGEMLGAGRPMEEALEELKGRVAEGVATAAVAFQHAREARIDAPILAALCGLMNREIGLEEFRARIVSSGGA